MMAFIRATPWLAAAGASIWLISAAPADFWTLAPYALGAELAVLLAKLAR